MNLYRLSQLKTAVIPVTRWSRAAGWAGLQWSCGSVFISFLSLSVLSAQEIYLLPKASVTGGVVRLGDVAEVQGGNAAERSALQDLALRPYSPDQPALSAREIREVLLADGWNLLYWQVTGASQVTLQPTAGDGTQGRRAVGPNSSANLSSRRLAATPIGTRFPPTPPAAQRTGIVQAQWREALLEETAPATMSGPQVATPSPARNTPSSQVWALKQDMSRGQLITAEDLEWITLPRAAPVGAVIDREQIVGQVLRSSLPAGRPIVSQNLESIKHVQRGKEVKLLSRVGGLEVSTTARAQADGTLGQTVTIESLDRKRQYIGQVVGFNTVQVVSRESLATATMDTATAGDSARPETMSRRSLPNTLRR